MFFNNSRLFYGVYRLNGARGNFDLKITPDQLIYQFGIEIPKVFPQFNYLPQRFKVNFAKRVLNFLNQYAFVTKDDAFVSVNEKILIASSYVKLTLGFSNYLVNTFHTIIIYPTARYFPDLEETHTGHFNPKLGVVMLALDEFKKDILVNSDGKDLALHEFTHALCFEMLQNRAKHPNSELFVKNFRQIQRWFGVPENRNLVESTGFVRSYAFTNHLELVAILIELFFEKNRLFEEQFPELYFFVRKMINHPELKR